MTVRLGVRDVSMHLWIYFPKRPAEGAAARRHIVVRVSSGAAAARQRQRQYTFGRRGACFEAPFPVCRAPSIGDSAAPFFRRSSAASRLGRETVSSCVSVEWKFCCAILVRFSECAIACGLHAAAAADGKNGTGTGQDRSGQVVLGGHEFVVRGASDRFANQSHRSYLIKSRDVLISREKLSVSNYCVFSLFIHISTTLIRNFCVIDYCRLVV